MIKDKVYQIIETLTTITKNGSLVWSEVDPKSKERKHKRNMFSLGEDGTRYEIEIMFKLDNSGSWIIEKEPSLWVRNKSLPNGYFYIYGGTYDLKELRDAVKNKYCVDMNPSAQDVEDALGDIVKGISIVELRDSKLNKILNVFGLSSK
jgi:hypothetical protein